MAKKAKTTSDSESLDLLSDVTVKTTKPQLLDKLRKAVSMLHAKEDERVAKMQEIEERVRAKFVGDGEVDLRSVTLMSTPQEFTEMVDFLENFEDIMPVAMHRLLAGARAVSTQQDEYVLDDDPV